MQFLNEFLRNGAFAFANDVYKISCADFDAGKKFLDKCHLLIDFHFCLPVPIAQTYGQVTTFDLHPLTARSWQENLGRRLNKSSEQSNGNPTRHEIYQVCLKYFNWLAKMINYYSN